MRRIKAAQVPLVTAKLLAHQKYLCPICGINIRTSKKVAALDHDHTTGYIRGILCVNCNGIEGKIFNLLRRVGSHQSPDVSASNLVRYWEDHRTPKWGGLFHHTHRTEEEKRVARNKKAVVRRKKAKEAQ